MSKHLFLTLILTILTILVTFTSSAQYLPTSYETNSRLNLSQIDNRELSTLLFFEVKIPSDSTWQQSSQWMNVSDKTYLSIPGSNKKFKMLSTVNMPIDSEAEHKMMLFDHAGQRHQFVLEFEKIPDDCNTFDLIEVADKPNAFNISNITFNLSDSVQYVNVDDFIADYPLKEYGQYYVNGTVVHYVKYDGIIVNAVAKLINQYGKYVSINISVQNYRNKSILFNPANLSAIGYKHPKKKKSIFKKTKDLEDDIYVDHTVRRDKDEEYDTSISIPFDVELLTYEEYDRIVKKKQNWQSFWVALGEGLAAAGAGYSSSYTSYNGSSYTTANAHAYGNVGGVYGYANAYGSSYTTAYGQSRTSSHNGLAAYIANQQAAANIADLTYAQSQIRQQIGDGYVKLHTIPAETEYSGFFNIKYNKKLQGLTFTLMIDEEPYTFYF